MKFNTLALANAAAVWMGAVYLLCAAAVGLFPGMARGMMISWFHGIDTNKMWSDQPFSGNIILGFISAIVLTWIGAYLFAYLYNYFLAKK